MQLLIFSGLTILISWGEVWIPLALLGVESSLRKMGAFGLALTALLLIGARLGPPGFKQLLEKLTLRRARWGWYTITFLGTPFVMLAGIQSYIWLGGGLADGDRSHAARDLR